MCDIWPPGIYPSVYIMNEFVRYNWHVLYVLFFNNNPAQNINVQLPDASSSQKQQMYVWCHIMLVVLVLPPNACLQYDIR